MKGSEPLKWFLHNLSFPDFFQKSFDIDDFDPLELFKVSEVRISGDDVIGIGLQGTGQEHVVKGVFGYLFN